jgi:hypothetical protein
MTHAGNTNAGPAFAIACTTCHNQHGNEPSDPISTNKYMVKREIDGTLYGQGGVNTLAATFLGTSVSKAGFYYDANVGTTLICEACHPMLQTSQHGTSKNATDCAACHSHKAPSDVAWDDDTISGGWSDPTTTPPVYVCGDCHVIPKGSGAHAAHADGIDGDYTDCVTCHGNNGDNYATVTGTHGNGGLTLDTVSLGYLANGAGESDDTCNTVNCHGTASWDNTAVPMTCNSCHYYTSGTMGLSATHQAHIDAGKACTSCHENYSTQTAAPRGHITSGTGTDAVVLTGRTETLQNVDNVIVLRTGLTFDDVPETDNFCSGTVAGMGTGCHATGTTGTPVVDWDLATTVDTCTECHTNKTNAAFNPMSGLHTASQAGVQVHDETLKPATACEACHSNKAAMTGHWNGTLASDNTGVLLGIPTAMYTDTTTGGVTTDPRGTCAGTSVNVAAGCHTDNGRWKRKWTTAANSTSQVIGDARCDACHGDGQGTDTTFNYVNAADVLNHTKDWPGAPVANVIGTHTDGTTCGTCHGLGSTQGTGVYDWATDHDDGNIEMNGPDATPGPAAGTKYSDTGFWCEEACHGFGAGIYQMADSTWPLEYADYGGGSCLGCHGIAGTGTNEMNNWVWGANKATVSLDEYNGWGHGFYGVTCDQCHTNTVSHQVAGNYNRLTSTDINTMCNNVTAACHLGRPVLVNHDTTSMGLTTPYPKLTWSFQPKCIDCHDPHGDNGVRTTVGGTANASMMHDDLFDAGSSVDGIPATYQTDYSDFVGTAGIGTGYWAETTANPGDGLCQECHDASVAQGTGSYRDNTSTFAGTHSSSTACASCHKHNGGFKGSGCDGCHGNGAGSFWPDGSTANEENHAGSHPKHVVAIATARGIAQNSTCVSCHPTGQHSGDTVVPAEIGSIQTMSGGSDTNATYAGTPTFKCSDSDCHNGVLTPNWYDPIIPDTTPPNWSSGHPLLVSDAGSGGTLIVNWSGANDADSPPVRFDLYRDQDGVDVCGTGTLVGSDLSTGAYEDSGLTDGQTYHYCVLAKDQATPANTTPSTTPASGTPTAPVPPIGTPVNTTYYATWAAPPTNIDGTNNPLTSATTYDLTTTGYGRKLLSTATATSSRFHYEWQSGNASFQRYARFYMDLAGMKAVGNGTNVTITSGLRSNNATNTAYFRLLNHENTVAGGGTEIGISNTVTITATAAVAGYTFVIPTMAQTVIPDTSLLVLELMYKSGTSATANRVYVGGSTNITGTYLTLPVATASAPETVPPVFTGTLTATDAGTGGAVNLSWPTATDADGSTPIRYRVWWSSGVIDYGNPINGNAVTLATSLTVTGLTDATAYNFGVKAVDANDNLNNTPLTASATPSGTPPPAPCGACHTWPQTSGAHTAHGATDNPQLSDVICERCHGDLSAYTGAHQNGAVGFTGTIVYSKASTPGDVTGTCSGTGTSCHGASTPTWNNPASVSCGSCHGKTVATEDRSSYADTGDSVQGAPPLDKSGAGTGTKVGKHLAHANVSWGGTGNSCDLCHNGKGTGTASHGNGGSAEVAFHAYAGGSALFTAGAPGSCSNLDTGRCHGTTTWNSTTTLTCADCHSGYTTHITYNGTAGTCTDCHPGGTLYTTRHANPTSDPNVVLIPNNATVGINNSYGGIHLGGDQTSTTATTEAEICWACHAGLGTPISEFGINNNASTGGLNYNYGTLGTTAAQYNWNTATWSSAQTASPSFAYKNGRIQSTHTANPAVTDAALTGADFGYTETPNAAGDIRCSNCHDVHERALAPGDTKAGQPYLRGTYRGNPYKEDGAPRSDSTYANTRSWGTVPRASTAEMGMGGYWIDRNSTNPTSTWSATDFAGLCFLCHGTSATIGSLDQKPSEALWIGANNGHANSVKGGTGTGTNVYDGRGGATSGWNPYAHWQGFTEPGDTSYGFRVGGYGWRLTPYLNNGSTACPLRYNSDEWVVDETGATTEANFHAFSCSKCHNPHASRLPKLMITNCLDTKHNTWDNGYQLARASATATANSNRSISNWSSAQNCHRRGGVDPDDARADQAGNGAGWNKVTPW